MEELWSPPRPEVADAIRSLCQRLLTDTDVLVDALEGPTRAAQNAPSLLADASLAEENRQFSRSDVIQWLTSNIQRPGRRVDPYVGSRTSAYISDLVSRGIAPDFTEGWRAALAVAWRRWLELCTTHCSDIQLLVEVLDVSAQSMVQYALDSVAAVNEAILAAGTGHADAEAIAMIQAIANGSPTTQDLAEGRLNYRMSRWHVAVVLWADDVGHVAELDEVIASSSTRNGKRYVVW